MKNRVKTAARITQVASLYNASALILFLVPGVLQWLGVQEPYSSFWRVLPALLASYGAITLWIASNDIEQLAILPAWNGIIRLVFVAATIAAGYLQTMGLFIILLVVGDSIVGLLTLIFVTRATNKPFINLILNK